MPLEKLSDQDKLDLEQAIHANEQSVESLEASATEAFCESYGYTWALLEINADRVRNISSIILTGRK